jgi:EAL domain-containing protein (putative c-di-GMP-specific phosphodiesterase class I)
MVAAINDIGHIMQMRTIAVSVESERTLARLTRMGVDYVQGFAIGHPFPLRAASADIGTGIA